MRRTLRRLVVVLTAAVSVGTATSCTSSEEPAEGAAGAGSPATTSPADVGTYLALGDSVPFGYRAGADAEFSDPANFVGYPELVGAELGLEVLNAACPGETTVSFLDVQGQSNGCTNTLMSDFGYRLGYPVHVQYESQDQSQLSFAVETLTESDVELVTVQIGANDAFVCQQTTADRCSSAASVEALGQTVQANLDLILSTLRDEGGYDGQIVVLTYYALDYSDELGAATALLGNGIAQVAEANGATVADSYAAFREAATAAGGSSIDAGLVLPNDVHPTEEGQRLLAEAVTAVVE